jgi:hypothetical protein
MSEDRRYRIRVSIPGVRWGNFKYATSLNAAHRKAQEILAEITERPSLSRFPNGQIEIQVTDSVPRQGRYVDWDTIDRIPIAKL